MNGLYWGPQGSAARSMSWGLSRAPQGQALVASRKIVQKKMEHSNINFEKLDRHSSAKIANPGIEISCVNSWHP